MKKQGAYVKPSRKSAPSRPGGAPPRGKDVAAGKAAAPGEMTYDKLMREFKRAYEWKKPWLVRAREDVEFALGKQWKTEHKLALEKQGKPALTINKIRPTIFLLSGIESQNRTDFTAMPEGDEDSLKAEIATILMRNVVKNSGMDYKNSQAFEEKLMAGEGYVEAYPDHTYDLLNAELKFKKLGFNQVFPEPGYLESDMSDAAYLDKVTYDLSMDQLVSLFPDKEELIRTLKGGHFNFDADNAQGVGGTTAQRTGYPAGEEDAGVGGDRGDEPLFDLVEHYYKKYVPLYFVIDTVLGKVKTVDDKAMAENYAKTANAHQIETMKTQAATTGAAFDEEAFKKTAHVVKRMIPEIWVASAVGGADELLEDVRAWCFPRSKGYPIFVDKCYSVTAPVHHEDRDLLVQGIVRGQRDPQFEHNKAVSQELHHLNTSANSGFMYEENSLVDEEAVKKFGSSAGVHIVYKTGKQPPTKIEPSPLSIGHERMAERRAQDMKDISGINSDLLAMQDGSQSSGRAIGLRLRQGMVMVQKIFDNTSQMKLAEGRFILAQLGNVFDINRAVRVLGETYLNKNFQKPRMAPAVDPRTGQPVPGPGGQPMTQPMVDPQTGAPVMEFDQARAMQTINEVLNDAGLGKYDVQVAESASNETVKYANYLTLQDVATKAATIPPPFLDALIEESGVSEATKADILKGMREMQAQAAAAAARTPPAGK